MIKSGTRRELPDGELCADRVRELLKLDVLEKKYPHVAEEIRSFAPPRPNHERHGVARSQQ
jgi:hypothetical protein